MNKIKGTLFLLLIFVVVSFQMHGQMGFQNKKNILSIDGCLNTPILSGNFNETIYRKKGDELVKSKERINNGLSFGYTRQVSRAVGFGLEGFYKQTKLKSPEYFLTENTVPNSNVLFDTSFLRMEQIQTQTLSYMIKVEFSNKLGIAPGGIVHSISFGISHSQINHKKKYSYSINQFQPVNEYEGKWTKADNYYFTYKLPKFKSTTFSYVLTYRHPFSDKLFGDIGVRYVFNYALKPNQQVFNENDPHPIDYAAAFYDLQRENLITINFVAGLSFVF